MNRIPSMDRRDFLKYSALLSSAAFLPLSVFGKVSSGEEAAGPRKKKPGLVMGAFFYPPAEVVDAGKLEDTWSPYHWHTWPGNQFNPQEQEKKFRTQLARIVRELDLELQIQPAPIYTDKATQEFLTVVEERKPDALLLINFWNSLSRKIKVILEGWPGPKIVYQPVGASHQLPLEYLRTSPATQYIHSIENWEALERGLRAVHAMNRMRQSRLLRVSGQTASESDEKEPWFNLPMHTVPADHFNRMFDETVVTSEMRQFARAIRRGAGRITDLSEDSFLDAAKAHAAVRRIMALHDADAITIECLFLKHRKPCLSFSINNSNLVPCGCENHLEATLTQMLGANLFGRAGFQHNPEFDTEQNLYFGAHCTCATRLHGPKAKPARYDLRPFFHQLPKTPALDVQWPAGERITLCKYHTGKPSLDAWRGTIVSSPASPPTGGCATRVLVRIDGVQDICSIYGGPHPVLYCGDFARHLKTFSQLYQIPLTGNA